MSQEQFCAWCGHLNKVDVVQCTFCKRCGHRADATKDECDCVMCLPFPTGSSDDVTALPQVPDLAAVFAPFEQPDVCEVVCNVNVDNQGPNTGRAVFSVGRGGAGVVYGETTVTGSPRTVAWPREQLVEMAKAIWPFLTSEERFEVAESV